MRLVLYERQCEHFSPRMWNWTLLGLLQSLHSTSTSQSAYSRGIGVAAISASMCLQISDMSSYDFIQMGQDIWRFSLMLCTKDESQGRQRQPDVLHADPKPSRATNIYCRTSMRRDRACQHHTHSNTPSTGLTACHSRRRMFCQSITVPV